MPSNERDEMMIGCCCHALPPRGGGGRIDPTRALAHAEAAVQLARRGPASSALIYPLFVLANTAQRSDPERALAAAEECVRIDRTHRKVWSTGCECVAAKIRVDRGAIATGLRLWRDVLHRFDWTGELVQISFQLLILADSIAGIDPGLALELAAISESRSIAPFAAFDMPGFDGLADAVKPARLERPRSRTRARRVHVLRRRDAFVFDAIDRLIADASSD